MGSADLRLLRPAVKCPACGAPPRMRIPAAERDRHMEDAPQVVVATLQCHARRCMTVYEVSAEAYQKAA